MSLLELLTLERPLIVFDTETTGPNPQADRIVEIGFIQFKPDGSLREWQSYVNPGMPIPHEATHGNPDKGYEGHGITDEMVAQAPTFFDLAPHLLKGFQACDYGGYNIRGYDLPLLASEFQRTGHAWTYQDARILDGFRLWQLGEGRTLTDAVEKFLGEKHAGAHRALDDVRASVRVIVAQLRAFTGIPRDLGRLHDLAYPRDPNAIDPAGKIIWQNGVATMNFGKNWKGMRLDLMARKDLEWIVSPQRTGISPEVKQICLDALAGKFPVKETKE